MRNIKIYTAAGETILLNNVNWNKIKSKVVSKNYDGSYNMKNGDLLTII